MRNTPPPFRFGRPYFEWICLPASWAPRIPQRGSPELSYPPKRQCFSSQRLRLCSSTTTQKKRRSENGGPPPNLILSDVRQKGNWTRKDRLFFFHLRLEEIRKRVGQKDSGLGNKDWSPPRGGKQEAIHHTNTQYTHITFDEWKSERGEILGFRRRLAEAKPYNNHPQHVLEVNSLAKDFLRAGLVGWDDPMVGGEPPRFAGCLWNLQGIIYSIHTVIYVLMVGRTGESCGLFLKLFEGEGTCDDIYTIFDVVSSS